VWSLLIALIIGFIYMIPGGIIFAMTSTQVRFCFSITRDCTEDIYFRRYRSTSLRSLLGATSFPEDLSQTWSVLHFFQSLKLNSDLANSTALQNVQLADHCGWPHFCPGSQDRSLHEDPTKSNFHRFVPSDSISRNLAHRFLATAQVVATVLTSFVQVGVKRWLLSTVTDICTPHQAAFLVCPGATVFYSSSVFWCVP